MRPASLRQASEKTSKKDDGSIASRILRSRHCLTKSVYRKICGPSPLRVGEKNDLSVHAVEWSRRGSPCVLLHGFGDNASVWSHLAPRIMSRFRVVAVDMRGHGNSDRDPDANYDAQTFTADLAKVIAAFGFERTILIGHSWGAETAIRFAAANPAQIAALVIVDFGPELAQTGVDEVLKGFAEMPRAFGIGGRVCAVAGGTPSVSRAKACSRNLRATACAEQRAGRIEVKIDEALAANSELSRLVAQNGRYYLPELWAKLARIKCPSLVVRGAISRSLSR